MPNEINGENAYVVTFLGNKREVTVPRSDRTR